MIEHISTFSGIGAAEFSARCVGWKNVAHCEIDKRCREFLEKEYGGISYEDIRDTDFTIHRGVEVFTGSFPCQDTSNANQSQTRGLGLSGARTGLFYEEVRAIEESRPQFVVSENVSRILKTNRGDDFKRILYEFSRMGYSVEWRVCYASEKGAPHRRGRLYMVAYSNSVRIERNQSFFALLQEEVVQERRKIKGTDVEVNTGGDWLCESPVPFVDDGIPKGLSKAISAIGNSLVPQIHLDIFKAIDHYLKS
jgi:DNA-cytosine methyltransferase